MSAEAPVGSGSVDAYRQEADRFCADLDEQLYLHYAGLKDELDLAPVYERYADLFTLTSCRELGAAAEGEGGAGTELWKFACEGYLGALANEDAEKVAELEATLEAEVDGEKVPFRLIRPEIANEPDRDRREKLERARRELTDEHLNPLYGRMLERTREGTRELGAETYLELYERFGLDLRSLGAACERLLAETEDLYVRAADKLFRTRLGIGLEEATRPDILRMLRATDWDAGFPADAMLPALTGTLGELGIDLAAQANVELDVERRPRKSPRAFCAPIEVPGRVVLVIQPMGGPDDWHALFHEAGHTEHYAHTAGDLPLEARRLGDNAVTEGWAALLELLVDNPVWLARRLDFGKPEDFASEAAAVRLYLIRRYAAKLVYELELHAGAEPEAIRPRYAELLEDATKIEASDVDFLGDVDAGFYASSYLRSWAFEAQVQAFLRDEFGSAWFSRREAGSLLRELWAEGQRLSADELLGELADSALELEAVVERTKELVRA
jgi:hypothetical protein